MKRLIFVVLLVSAMCFTGCRTTQYVPVETIKTEYKTRDSIRIDSVYRRDSIYVIDRGDTVYTYKDRYLYKYLYLNRIDTVIKTDSIQIPYPVEKALTRWQKAKIELGGWAFGVLIMLAIVLIIRLLKN
ncbi:hypothetical protein O1504_13380 [Bacteroides fragilis]|uniref:hypothetical protein n=1 Tax=Bacteroides fragilis TaxID=817 RepID=UPI0022AA53EC|nr:hypothetical protein [Bacteroides fragilis]MCZ2590789.1 hypothetical protein [Bacteroides fragilis]